MSSIRLFLLDAFERQGEMHGHQLRLLAEEEHVHNWTDITVGAIYGAIKRLAHDGLLEIVRTEREGNFPERHVYAITHAGRQVVSVLRQETLLEVTMKPDPFDLALARLDPHHLGDLARSLELRRETLETMLSAGLASKARALPYLTLAEMHALGHRIHRLRSEIDWLDTVLADLPAILSDEASRLPAA